MEPVKLFRAQVLLRLRLVRIRSLERPFFSKLHDFLGQDAEITLASAGSGAVL